jgi:hypothetical protein
VKPAELEVRAEELADAAASPVFMLSPQRSYSTVSLALLAGHPGLFGFPETLLMTSETVGELIEKCADWAGLHGVAAESGTAELFRQSRLIGLARTIAHLHEGSDADDALVRALEWVFAHRHGSTAGVMSYLLRLARPRVVIEKSPDVAYSNASLRRCVIYFPKARYLHLTRHPIGTVRSMSSAMALRRGNRALEPSPEPKSFIVTWYSCHLRIVKTLENIPAERRMRVRAEDLLGDPETSLRNILSWLRIDSSDAVIARMMQTEKWAFAHGRPGAALGGDWKFYADPALRSAEPPGPRLVDPEWGIPSGMHRKVIALARYLGY